MQYNGEPIPKKDKKLDDAIFVTYLLLLPLPPPDEPLFELLPLLPLLELLLCPGFVGTLDVGFVGTFCV
jgi:hypothetical protein